jgi:hypothetical protein
VMTDIQPIAAMALEAAPHQLQHRRPCTPATLSPPLSARRRPPTDCSTPP